MPGFTLKRGPIPLHFQMDTWDAKRDPSGAPPIQRGHYHAFRRVVWHAGRGIPRSNRAPDGSPLARKVYDLRGPLKRAPNHWETVVDASQPRRLRVFHSCQAPDDVVWVQTDGWEENLGFTLDFTDLQIARGQQGQARIRIEWGKIFSIVLRDGAAPTFEKRVHPQKALKPKSPTDGNNNGGTTGNNTNGTGDTTGTGSNTNGASDNASGVPAKVAKELPKKKADKGDDDKPKKGELKPNVNWRVVSDLSGAGELD